MNKIRVEHFVFLTSIFISSCAHESKQSAQDAHVSPQITTSESNPYAQDRLPASLSQDLKKDFFGTLKKMNHEDLDRLYYYGTVPDELPLGKFDGKALMYNAQQGDANSWWKSFKNGIEKLDLVKGISGLAWQGKTFKEDGTGGESRDLKNRLLFVTEGVSAKVYRGKMLVALDKRFGIKRNTKGAYPEGAGMIRGDGLHLGMEPVYIDGGDSIIIDYADTKIKGLRPVVDEIRQIESAGAQHYLGRATFEGKFAIFFALKPIDRPLFAPLLFAIRPAPSFVILF
jgi:hypothetical protein